MVGPDATSAGLSAVLVNGVSAKGLVISQVYGGGGNSGATYKNDFIELYNGTADSINLSGTSVQYASGTGATWQITPLSGWLKAGRYYLIQEAAGTSGTVSLPTPDAVGTGAGIPMSATTGKVALVARTTAVTNCADTTVVIDIVAYGTGSTCAEGGVPAATLSNTTAALRRGDGLTDTQNNGADFVVAPPSPRNSGFIARPVASVSVSPSTWTLKINATRSFTATAKAADSTVTTTTFTWTSSAPAVATVNQSSGLVTAKSLGTTTITATAANGVSGSAQVIVSAADVGISSRAAPLPVGFQSQLFVNSGSTDAKGDSVGNSNVVWSSSNPAVVSVDPADGVITARALGSAVITAAAKSDGSSGATTITTSIAAVAPNARVGHNTELGTPTDADPTDEVIIARRQYTLSYNASRGGPNWVSWNLDETHKGGVARCNCFTADTALTRLGLPAYDTNDWINGGVWSRGHMSPSADWAVSDGDNAPTFFLTNMLPQNQAMNGGSWGNLENYLRTKATGGAEIYIIAGGIFTKDRSGPGLDGFGFMASRGRIAVPDSIWKIAVIVPDDRAASGIAGAADVEVIAVNIPNEAPKVAARDTVWNNFRTTIDRIQKSTGYDFLSALPERVQCAIESRNCAPVAALAGSGLAGGNEGDALSFTSTGSADANGDVLSYEWAVAGTVVGHGSALTYTFPNDGAYEVRLVVADPAGAADTATATVTIRNVAPTVAAFSGASIDEGGVYTVSGSFADPGDDRWTLTVDYGDGASEELAYGADKRFTLAHRYADDGSYTVTVTATERSATAASGAQSATVSVANVAPAVAGVAGATILRGERYATSGTFTDPGADSWTATVDYGDGSAEPLALRDGGFALEHVYASAGTYTVTVRVTDDDGGVGTTTARVVVQTAIQGVANLSAMLPSLGLGAGETNSLRAKLNAATAQLRRDSASEAAPHVLDAFMNELDALVRSGRITAEAAAPLTEYARRVVASIGG